MAGPRFYFVDIVFASITKTWPCPLTAGGASFLGGNAGTRNYYLARTAAATFSEMQNQTFGGSNA